MCRWSVLPKNAPTLQDLAEVVCAMPQNAAEVLRSTKTPKASISLQGRCSIVSPIDMKRMWLLIVTGVCITSCSKYYTVEVANGLQGERDFQFLTQWAAENNYYWKQVSEETDTFRTKIAESFGMQVYDLLSMQITARCLVRFIKANGTTPRISEESRQAAFLRQQIKPSAYFLRQINVIRKAEAERRNKPKPMVSRIKVWKPLKEDDPSVDGHPI